tara:strand:+ start:986 stop:1318 length:333 start_codon:yes stop_codon:yes gene_type:complete
MILILFMFLTGCLSANKYIGKDYIPSNSPCLDGTVSNMEAAGCDVFYFGTIMDQSALKIRCTSSSDENFWTESSFYATRNDYEELPTSWIGHCADNNIIMFFEFTTKSSD